DGDAADGVGHGCREGSAFGSACEFQAVSDGKAIANGFGLLDKVSGSIREPASGQPTNQTSQNVRGRCLSDDGRIAHGGGPPSSLRFGVSLMWCDGDQN